MELKNDITIINDSYNASFESMKASIEYLGDSDSTRKIAVLGDMFELGDFSEELHRKVGKEVCKNNVDFLITIGENAQYIVDEAMVKGFDRKKTQHFIKKEELINFLEKFIKSGDTVLFKASNGMRLFDVVEKLRNK